MRPEKDPASLEKLCVEDSRLTNETSEFRCVKKISLDSCRSMVSVESHAGWRMDQGDRKLVMKFLMYRKNWAVRSKYLEKMREAYHGLCDKNEARLNENVGIKLGKLPKPFSLDDRQPLEHYFSSWLTEMGHQNPLTKNRILAQLHSSIPT